MSLVILRNERRTDSESKGDTAYCVIRKNRVVNVARRLFAHCHHGRGKGGVGPSHTKLKCIYSNVDTLLNKRTELHYLHEHDQPDIVSLTENLPKNVKFAVQLAELQVDGYDCFSNICDGNLHKGVVVYVKKH